MSPLTDVTPTCRTRDLQRSSRDTKNTVELPALDFVQLSNPMRPKICSHVEISQSHVEFPESSVPPLYPRQHLLVSSLIYIHNLLNNRSSKVSSRSVSQAGESSLGSMRFGFLKTMLRKCLDDC
ncbi:hypothetical protein EPI10_022453 [Gossypium australe]|uniref:Uncharacterized protein n=1 Tax=Gossypium australe TaxID=47621 RepID=A0A5B6VSM6_9ROSI|nr:hypothetical protein EPI10_022453 [Gossypium australe]